MNNIRTLEKINDNDIPVNQRRMNKILYNLQKQGISKNINFFKHQAKRNRFCNSRTPSFIDKLESIIKVLDNTFGDKWDFYLDFNRVGDDEKWNGLLYLNIMIHYPEIIITNSEDLEHTIKDLIVILEMRPRPNNMLSIIKVNGLRTTLSKKEFLNNYIHSHLPKKLNNKIFSPEPFCLGENTEVKESMKMLDDATYGDDYEVYFESFLFNLQSLLEWESAEGVPYVYINSIKDSIKLSSPIILNYYTIRNYGNRIIRYLANKPELTEQIEFLYDNGLFKIKNDKKFKRLIRKAVIVKEEIFDNTFLFSELYSLLLIERNGEILTTNPDYKHMPLSLEHINNPEHSVLLNGKELKFIIEQEQEQEENEYNISLDNFFINPEILNYVKNKLKTQLQYAIIKKNHLEGKNKNLSA